MSRRNVNKMRCRRPTTVYTLSLIAFVCVFLLVVLYNGRTDYGHTPLNHNDEVLNIQQKVLKFEQRSKKRQWQDDIAHPSKILHSNNHSNDSYLASYSNFSDDEARERPSHLTGDNAKEVRVSSSTDNHHHHESDDDDDVQDSVHENAQDDVEGKAQAYVQDGPNRVRDLASQARTKKQKVVKEKEEKVERPRGLRRLFLHEWDEYNPLAWKELPLLTGLKKAESLSEPAIVYNRVGKCGSRSVINILRQLALKNQFHLVSSLVYNKTRFQPEVEKNMVKIVSQIERPYVFQRHLHFIDFRRYQVEQPKYINIIRDPLARMVSQYYFKRFGDGKSERGYSGEDKYQTFDECVLKEKSDCLGKRAFYIIPFFCGQDPRCKEATTWSLNKAMQHVRDFYVAVGLLEELEDTFKVFEAVLPRVFGGVSEVYREMVSGELQKNISVTFTKHKVKPSSEVTKIMKERLKLEYIFYEFVKQRFHTQKKDFGIL